MKRPRKVLYNISNHPSSGWSEEQRAEWDVIIDIPFPKIDPYWDSMSKPFIEALVSIKKKIREALRKEEFPGAQVFFYIAGEFSFCYELLRELGEEFINRELKLAIPTTDRVVVEKQESDGSVKKESVFKFVRWRIV